MADKEEQKKRLTPMEIHNKEFKKRGLSGYDRHEVDSFLDQIVNDYGDVMDQNSDLKNEVVQLNSRVSDLQGQVDKYQQTGQTVQEMVDQAKARAQKIVNDATVQANTVTAQARADADYQRQQLETIKTDYDHVKEEVAGYRSYIQELLQQVIKQLNDDRWQKALDHYFGTERFYPPDGAEPITLVDDDEDLDIDEPDDDAEVDNQGEDEVDFDDEDDEEPQPIEGDSPSIEVVNQQDESPANNAGTTIIFPDDYKNHN